MRSDPTANEIRGRAMGALFFTFFGAVWLLLALYARQELTTLHCSAILVSGLLLVGFAILLNRRARQFPTAVEDPARSRTFSRINAAQWIAIAAVAFTFARLHMDAYVLSAITVIVGLHLLPLARLIRYAMHYVSAAALAAWGLASIFIFPLEQLQSMTAIGTGLLLWLSAATTLVLAFVKTQHWKAPAQAQS